LSYGPWFYRQPGLGGAWDAPGGTVDGSVKPKERRFIACPGATVKARSIGTVPVWIFRVDLTP